MTAFFQKTRKKSYDLFSGYSHYVPGIKGTVGLILLLLAGNLMGSAVVFLFGIFFSADDVLTYGPSFMSRRNELFDTGYALDSNNFGKAGGWLMAIMVSVATLAVGFLMDPVNAALPKMPESLEKILENMVSDGPLWVSLLSVSVMAPFFEEWLCRGMILRGLLRKMHPVWAMVISSFCFALIHFNPWQGIPAFVLGMLFAYVYYKTGSLKLTIFMFQIMDRWQYISLLAASLVIIVLFVDIVWKNIPMKSPEGNMDIITTEDMDTPDSRQSGTL